MIVEFRKAYVNTDDKYSEDLHHMLDVMRQQPVPKKEATKDNKKVEESKGKETTGEEKSTSFS